MFVLGLGFSEPRKLFSQSMDIENRPHVLHLEVVKNRGALFPIPKRCRACYAPDFSRFSGTNDKPFIFVTPRKGEICVTAFRTFMLDPVPKALWGTALQADRIF